MEEQAWIQKPISAWADDRVAGLLEAMRSPWLPRCLGRDPSDSSFYRWEYIQGETLRQRGARPLEPARLEVWFNQILQGLALITLAADKPFAHLDISPGNIIITPHDQAVLIDLASARFLDGEAESSATLRSMTAGYAAPEVYFGRLCPQTDLYSLAMSLLAALTGRMAAELDQGAIKKALDRLDRSFAKRLAACLQEDPELRAPAVRGTLYGNLLRETGGTYPTLTVKPQERASPCPHSLEDCPFMRTADRIRQGKGGSSVTDRPGSVLQ